MSAAYSLLMIATRLCAFLLLAALTTAQQTPAHTAAKSTIPEPKLPVVDYNACPFEGCVFREWTVRKQSTIYDTWRDNRKAIGQLAKAEKVQGITGVHVTRKPDRFLVKQAIPSFSVVPGDSILQYAEWGEGASDLWAKGVWHKASEGDYSQLDVDNVELVQHGVKEWWVEVKRKNGQQGWALSHGNFGNMDRLGDSSNEGDKNPIALLHLLP